MGNPDISTQTRHLDFFIQYYQYAIDQLQQQYAIATQKILFFICLPSQPHLALETALSLNLPSVALNEFTLAQQKILSTLTTVRNNKLQQIDQDFLVDLAQLVLLDPCDPFMIANHTYILTLKPQFLELNPYIQSLAQTICVMDDPNFYLARTEILARIEQFYPVLK